MRRGAIEGPDLAFEIILRRIYHGDMLSGVKAQYLACFGIIARKRQRELFLDLIGQNPPIKEKLRERHGNPYLRAEGLWSNMESTSGSVAQHRLKEAADRDQTLKAPPIERPNSRTGRAPERKLLRNCTNTIAQSADTSFPARRLSGKAD